MDVNQDEFLKKELAMTAGQLFNDRQSINYSLEYPNEFTPKKYSRCTRRKCHAGVIKFSTRKLHC